MLTDAQANAVDFVTYVDEQLGAKIWASDGKLMILPKGKLRPGDAEFIKANKATLLDVLADKRCCKVCPGVEHELCAGCPSPNIEIMFAGGLIAPQWCSSGIDKCATHWRERGGEWVVVGSSKGVAATGRTPTKANEARMEADNE